MLPLAKLLYPRDAATTAIRPLAIDHSVVLNPSSRRTVMPYSALDVSHIFRFGRVMPTAQKMLRMTPLDLAAPSAEG